MAGIFRIIGGIVERLTHATSTEATATIAAKLGEAATHVRTPADRVTQTLPRASELSVARDRAGTGRDLCLSSPSRRSHRRDKGITSMRDAARIQRAAMVPERLYLLHLALSCIMQTVRETCS